MEDCPACDSSDIDAHDTEIYGDEVLVHRVCFDCNHQWTDTYRLVVE